jgi:16S rRNA (adenine1518-N6/adenine1519-N6)-dimethyltransferase
MNFRVKKSLGQHFLIDKNICRKIVDALDIVQGDHVLEIGPGQGALTGFIYQKGAGVFALEKDRDLCQMLKNRLPGVAIACADALAFDWSRLDRIPGLKIAGNLPYNIASRLLWDMALRIERFEAAVFMVQKEVGRRIVASPGSKDYGGLTVWIQSFWKPQILFNVSPMVFRPKPKVDSVVLKFTPLNYEKKIFTSQNLAQTIRIMFQNRRKQVGTILKTYWNDRINFFFQERGISPRSRPENLSPHVFQGLSDILFSDKKQILS